MHEFRRCEKCGRMMTCRIEYHYGTGRLVYSCDFCNYVPLWKYSISDRTESTDSKKKENS